MNVRSILRRKGAYVETASDEMTVRDAAQRMLDKKIGCLVVIDSAGSLLGILRERDFAYALTKRPRSAGYMTIGHLINFGIEKCKPEDSLTEVMSIMTRCWARYLPVIEHDALVGIVSLGDVLNQLEALEPGLGTMRKDQSSPSTFR